MATEVKMSAAEIAVRAAWEETPLGGLYLYVNPRRRRNAHVGCRAQAEEKEGEQDD